MNTYIYIYIYIGAALPADAAALPVRGYTILYTMHYTILYDYTKLSYVILYCTVLYYTILYYTILYYTIL